jgi:hypothetical protein
MSVPMRSIEARSGPKILIPTGVRTPVVSMSMRFLIGMVQALDTPGMRNASFIWETRSSVEATVLRHWDFGFSRMIVSIMENGAGSVDVSARPALPSTRSTSGKRIRMRSCTWSRRSASVTEMPGSVVGMNSSAPSSSGGMNSEPRLW